MKRISEENKLKDAPGCKIVLTGSRAEMTDYRNNPFRAFVCTFPELLSANLLKKYLNAGKETCPDGSAKFALYGLRKVESLLVDAFGRDNIVVSHIDNLHKFIGKKTELVCISSMDPMGLAYVSTTYNSLIGFGGDALNAVEFEKLMKHPSIIKYKPKIMLGGAGAWQIKEAGAQKKFGIDILFQGEGEHDLVKIVMKLLNNEPLPQYYTAKKPDASEIPLIKNSASYGMVEITRGCGRGCKFCSATMRKKHSFPIEHIMKEVEINIKGGANSIFTAGEDMFLYKSKPGFIPNRKEIVKLYETIGKYPGVEYIILSHGSLAPIIFDKKILPEISPNLMEKTYWRPGNGNYKRSFITTEVGIETGSSRLMRKNMKGKALPFSVDNWSELVVQGIGFMNDYDWWPLCTIMTAQPDETEDDVIATLEMIDDLRNANAKMFYTPLVFIPLEEAILGDVKRTSLENLSELQWEIVARCWRNNIDFWGGDKKWLYNLMFFFAHWFYARWRHGKKATRPMMRLAGIGDNMFGVKVGKECDRSYCMEKMEFKGKVYMAKRR